MGEYEGARVLSSTTYVYDGERVMAHPEQTMSNIEEVFEWDIDHEEAAPHTSHHHVVRSPCRNRITCLRIVDSTIAIFHIPLIYFSQEPVDSTGKMVKQVL